MQGGPLGACMRACINTTSASSRCECTLRGMHAHPACMRYPACMHAQPTCMRLSTFVQFIALADACICAPAWTCCHIQTRTTVARSVASFASAAPASARAPASSASLRFNATSASALFMRAAEVSDGASPAGAIVDTAGGEQLPVPLPDQTSAPAAAAATASSAGGFRPGAAGRARRPTPAPQDAPLERLLVERGCGLRGWGCRSVCMHAGERSMHGRQCSQACACCASRHGCPQLWPCVRRLRRRSHRWMSQHRTPGSGLAGEGPREWAAVGAAPRALAGSGAAITRGRHVPVGGLLQAPLQASPRMRLLKSFSSHALTSLRCARCRAARRRPRRRALDRRGRCVSACVCGTRTGRSEATAFSLPPPARRVKGARARTHRRLGAPRHRAVAQPRRGRYATPFTSPV
eukprot:365532-Chlamydomonas_euryale.AAC.13